MQTRDIPILPQLYWVFAIPAILLFIAGGIMQALKKPEFPSDEEHNNP